MLRQLRNTKKIKFQSLYKKSLREKCPCWELFWSSFLRIRTEYGGIRTDIPHLPVFSLNEGKCGQE